MSTPSSGEQLAAAISTASETESRLQMLLWPSVSVIDGCETVSFYYYDIPDAMAARIVVDVDDYADTPADVAAERIIGGLFP